MADAVDWTKRVAAWRASKLSAEEFSRDEGYSPHTLRWWSSKLKRKALGSGEVRIARVRRGGAAGTVFPSRRSSTIVIEAVRSGARISVDADVDPKALGLVFELLGIGAST